jgi:segregation and condensation protein A
MAEYRVRTDVYNGPMDLLLYLIRRDEVGIYDIPIAHITEQYCQYVELLNVLDPNVAGDFLVLAATLMEIKSRMLLPRPVDGDGADDDLADPRLELVRQLLEYKKFKDVSFDLGDAARQQMLRWPRGPGKAGRRDAAEVDLEEAQIWDLVAAFNKIMSSIGAGSTVHDVIFDDTPIALHAADILERLQEEGGELGFEGVFAGRSKVEMIGLFLALLELIRQQRIRVTQPDDFAPIRIVLLSSEPIVVGDEWESAVREALLGPRTDDPENATVDRGDDPGDSPTSEAGPEGDEDVEQDDDWEGFDELEHIKTDVDIDAVLDRKPAARADEDQERDDP